MNDICISFNLDNNAFRGRIVRLDSVLAEIFARQSYPDSIAAAISETTALGILLANLLKFDGLFTLQMQGDGPLSMLVTDVSSKGQVRSCAKYDIKKLEKIQELRKTQGQIEAAPHLIGHGNLIFTVDQGKQTDMYQGIVDLHGKDLAECALRYFKNSEQIDTHLKLFSFKDANNKWQAGAILIQKMPTKGGVETLADDDNMSLLWEENKILLDSLQPSEMFDNNLPLEDLLFRLFHEHQLRIVKQSEFYFACRCSREKLFNTLSTMSEQDIEDMCENGKITATCNFCRQSYVFDKSEFRHH